MTFSARLWLTAISVVLAASILTIVEWLLAVEVNQADLLDDQNRAVVRAVTNLTDDLQDAESAQRGYLLTNQASYLQPYSASRARLGADLASLERSVVDAPEVAALVPPLQRVVAVKFDELAETIALQRAGRRGAALAVVRSGRGQNAMISARELLASIATVETRLRIQHEAAVARFEGIIFWLLVIGGPAVTLLVFGLTWLSVRRLRDSFGWLRERIAAIRAGGEPLATIRPGRDEFSPVAAEFDALAQELRLERDRRSHIEDNLRHSNDELTAQRQALVERADLSELRRRLANRLSGCLTLAECIDVTRQLLPPALQGVPGIFYLYDNSRRYLTPVIRWNEPRPPDEEFPPDQCWGLRRGQPHRVVDAAHDIVCTHVQGGAPGSYTCTPLSAQGETLGLLYLESARVEDVAEDELQILSEMVAIALANVRLRESLQTASLRDPLTGLFNRRYLQEAWDLESARAIRAGRTLVLLMLDIDHFKRFNDNYGHDAGDQVLKSVAEVLRKGTRTGDVVCRFGGEEFIVILVDADDQSGLARAEALRRAVRAMSLSYGAQQLGTVTISIGVATFPLVGSTFDEVQQVADAALYRAKAAGRDRVEVAALAPTTEPAPV